MDKNIIYLPKILIISIGDELIQSNQVNITAPKISYQLTLLGFEQIKILTIKDDLEDIKKAFTLAQEKIIITTGGLGATNDDSTVFSIAQALKLPLIKNKKHEIYLSQLIKNSGIVDEQLINQFTKQAYHPKGFQLERNPYGSSGFIYQIPKNKNQKFIFLLPGIPEECLPLLEKKVIPKIKELLPSKKIITLEIKIISVSETIVEQILFDIIKKFETKNKIANQIKLSFLPSNGELLVRLSSDYKNEILLIKIRKLLQQKFSNHISFLSSKPLSFYLHLCFLKNKFKIGFVESCTGGLITSEWVQYPGSSKYLDSSLITYSVAAKNIFAHVKKSTLKKYGQVSPETAQAMAFGLAKKRNLTLVLSATGIAGPERGSENKPVGLVYLGLYFFYKKKEILLFRKLNLKNDRNSIRTRTVKEATFFIADIFNQNHLLSIE